MDIGSRIRWIRERRGMTQKELAEKVGINQSVFNRIELGDRKVRDDELKRIAEVLDEKTDYLLGKDTEHGRNKVDAESTISRINEQASKLGYRVNDPEFLEILFDAIEIIRVARGKNSD